MSQTHPIETIAEARRTSLGLYVTAKEAYDMWQADPGLKILDVRTPEEYVFVGHAPMATNIPFALQTYEWDPREEGAPLGAQPRVRRRGAGMGCARRADPRGLPVRWSLRDGDHMLAKAAGFTNAWNILDGWEGSQVKDAESVFDGMRMKNGWKNSGLPWTYEIDPDRMTLPSRQSRTFVAGNEHD